MSGIPYGLWADSVEEMNEVARTAEANYHSMQEWKAYAKRLEKALDEVSGKFRDARDTYYDMAGAEKGQAALKEEALKELQKFDPSNKMLHQSHRKVIYDQAYNDTVARLKKN